MLEPSFSPGGSSMGRFSKVRRPTAAEVQQLQHMLATLPIARQRRRAEILVLYATGLAATAIAKLLGLHLNTVSHVLHLFKEHGLAAVTHMSVGGAPRQVSSYQVARIQRLADQPPTKRGLPYGRWSLAKLRDYVLQQRIVNRISREHLRRLLKKGAFVSSGFTAN
jgi:transposase